MAEVKWIKIVTDIFDDEKILFIEQLPEADSIIVIWFKLLTLAGKINNGGVLLFNDKLPYTDEMLATIFRRPINTVRLAIKTFIEFEMVEVINNTLTIPNWSKHQTLDQLEERKEYMKNYMREYRERQKLLAEGKVNSKVNSVPNSNANVNSLEVEVEGEEDIDKDKEEDIDTTDKIPPVPFEKIKELFNSTCKSYSSIRTLSNKRKEHVRARWKQYDYKVEVFEELFNKAESSNFLRGHNDRKWKADFDWLINDNNMAKVLEGRYENKGGGNNGKSSGSNEKEDDQYNNPDIGFTL